MSTAAADIPSRSRAGRDRSTHDAAMLPPVNRPLLRLFTVYSRWYLRRHFHAVRVSGVSLADLPADQPLLIYLNHPAWWDPMIALLLATEQLADRRHFAPIEAAMLERFRFFGKLGFFGIEKEGPRAAARFLRLGQAALARPDRALWVTAQGEFVDVRQRPIDLRPGVAHLARRLERGLVVPIALEYAFWEQRLPEALVRVGEPIPIEGADEAPVDRWQRRLREGLTQAMDRLAADVQRRDPARFRTMLAGAGGVSIVYDTWRSVCGWFGGGKASSVAGLDRRSENR
jgi:1-acyl-sn-glycerol-3-phosphate acyltransferase